MLIQGLYDVKVQKTEGNYFGSFDPKGAMDAYWVTYMRTADLEELAEEFFDKYCDDALIDR